jgi:hypothetical protein
VRLGERIGWSGTYWKPFQSVRRVGPEFAGLPEDWRNGVSLEFGDDVVASDVVASDLVRLISLISMEK